MGICESQRFHGRLCKISPDPECAPQSRLGSATDIRLQGRTVHAGRRRHSPEQRESSDASGGDDAGFGEGLAMGKPQKPKA